jgi:hypothetical protein
MESKILLLCFFLVSISDTTHAFKNVSMSNKTGKYNSTKRSKIRAVKIGENISVTKNVRKMVKRKLSLHNQENLCENLQNLVGM